MGNTAKKTPARKRRASVQSAGSPSKALKARTGQSPAPSVAQSEPVEATPRETAYTHALPTQEQRKGNGRRVGRSLIMWNRPRMAEKLLLHIHYECTRHKVQIPWDAIAHRLRPGSSGAAIMQHMNRLRKDLIAEGHLVPPVAQKVNSGPPLDASIRGYIRENMDGDDKETVRAVKFDEKLDDAKFNLPDAFAPAEDEEEQPEASDLDVPEQQYDFDLHKLIADNEDEEGEQAVFGAGSPSPARETASPGPASPGFKAENLFVDDATDYDGVGNRSFTLEHADFTQPLQPPELSQHVQTLEAALESFITPAKTSDDESDDISPDYDHSLQIAAAMLQPKAPTPSAATPEAPMPVTKAKPRAEPQVPSQQAFQQAAAAAAAAAAASMPSPPALDAGFFGSSYGGMMYPPAPGPMYAIGPNGMMMPMPMGMGYGFGYGFQYPMPGVGTRQNDAGAAPVPGFPFIDAMGGMYQTPANMQSFTAQAQMFNPQVFGMPQASFPAAQSAKVSPVSSAKSSPTISHAPAPAPSA